MLNKLITVNPDASTIVCNKMLITYWTLSLPLRPSNSGSAKVYKNERCVIKFYIENIVKLRHEVLTSERT